MRCKDANFIIFGTGSHTWHFTGEQLNLDYNYDNWTDRSLHKHKHKHKHKIKIRVNIRIERKGLIN